MSFALIAKENNPVLFCQETENCTPKMLDITNQYKVGNGKFTKLNLTAYSGSCYHISALYDPNHEHHGVFYFQQENNEYLIDGEFGFFYDEDPYKTMSSKEVRQVFLERGSKPMRALKRIDRAELEIKTSKTSDFHYWFRSSANQEKMYLIGVQFSGSEPELVYCDLDNRH